MATVADALALGERLLPRRRGIPDPRREALWLLAHATGMTELALRLEPERGVTAEAMAVFRAWLARRARGEPAHHLVGLCPFWGRSFQVSPSVLIPRPETELVVEVTLAAELPSAARVLDVGTGSGCLAVTLALERPGWQVVATDRSWPALAVAAANRARHGAEVALVSAHLGTALKTGLDLVVANLPYVPAGRLAALPVEVRHDPRLALDGGRDGLDLVRALLAELPRLLQPGGLALLELGEDQAGQVAGLAGTLGLQEVHRVPDVGGVDRVLGLRRPGQRAG